MEDKRRHPRIALDVPVSCEVAGKPPLAGRAVDISVGGLFIDAVDRPAIGTDVTIAGDLPGAPGLRLPGVVRWMKPAGYGVQFGLLGVHETHAITTAIQKAKVR